MEQKCFVVGPVVIEGNVFWKLFVYLPHDFMFCTLVEDHHCMVLLRLPFSLFFLDTQSEVSCEKVYLSYWA
jgi:hypothetical protein